MDIWLVSIYRSLWIVLLWTSVYKWVFFFFGTCLQFYWVYTYAKLYDNFMFKFLSNCQTLFPFLHHFTFLQAMHKYSNFSMFSAMFVICYLCQVDRLMLHHQRFLSPRLGSPYLSPHLTSSGKRDFSGTSSGNWDGEIILDKMRCVLSHPDISDFLQPHGL